MPEPHEPPTKPNANAALGLVRQGWHQLQLQRPLAAWAAWQRALRIDPDDGAAKQALETLESAPELPAAARAVYRFQTPADAPLRARWDARLRQGGTAELDAAGAAFAALTNENPADADAWSNLALCRAWLGENAAAVACLDRVVSLLAADAPERAVDAWVLAEVLRQGAGAEALADDVRYALTVEPGVDLLARWPNLVPVDVPADPLTGARRVDDGQVFEWLDRPPASLARVPDRAHDLPRVLAAVIVTPKLVRVSSPDPAGLALLDETAAASGFGLALADARREKAPLPIAWADAALGTFRLPTGLDGAEKASLTRSVVEHYFEDLWVHQPRHALGGLSPLEASRVAARGDVVGRAKIAAVVRYREQLGSRPSRAAVYQGYPFDRLRRRIGLLTPAESDAVDAADVSCMSERELDDLDPAALDDVRLADAFTSAAALRDDARTARFAARLARQGLPPRGRLDPVAVFAPLVRESLRLGDPDEALGWLKTALAGAGGAASRTFTVWSAEIHARTGSPAAALLAYQEVLDRPDAETDAALALDGAETLLDNGYPDEALPLLLEARTRAGRSGDRVTLRKAEILLGRPRP